MAPHWMHWLHLAKAACDLLGVGASEPGSATYREVSWSGRMSVATPHETSRELLRAALVRDYGYENYKRQPTMDYFSRGDFTIHRLPCERDVGWREVPIVLGVMYVFEPGPVIRMIHSAPPKLDFSEPAGRLFHRNAEAEFDAMFALLEGAAENGSVNGRHAGAGNGDAALREAFAVLGLEPGACLADVQAAYREACLKYHPDRLVGMPPHMVELASERFCRATEAYQLLRQRLGRQ